MKQQVILKSVGVLLVLGSLSACNSIPFIDNSSDYKGAGRSKPLEVPPDLTAMRTSDAYSIPGSATYSGYSQNQEVQEPGVEQVLPKTDGVVMEKSGQQRWLVVKAPAEKIWPIIREFWVDQGFAVRVESADTGVMETEWIKADAIKPKDDNRALGDQFDAWLDGLSGLADRRKFRTRLERGEQAGTTEIYMTHRTVAGAPDDGKNEVVTQLGKIDTGYRLGTDKKVNTAEQFDSDLDVELLRRLMIKLGVAEKQAEQIAANPVTPKRASVTKETDRSITLKVDDGFDRAWRRVGLALDRIGFVMEDKNRAEGLFYVRYADADIDTTPKPKKGLLETLKFWGDDKEDKTPLKAETTNQNQADFWKGSGEVSNESKQYRIKVAEGEDGASTVNVVDQEGKHNPSNTANKIISLLYDQLK
ncbi:MAG: outer membrane protein assembly factor BamC [Methylophilus sp.]|jgi:outer membrane protein assembly factor BamC